LEKKQYFLFVCSLQIIFLIELSIGSETEHHRPVVQHHRFVFSLVSIDRLFVLGPRMSLSWVGEPQLKLNPHSKHSGFLLILFMWNFAWLGTSCIRSRL
jgi:hypothetical protein